MDDDDIDDMPPLEGFTDDEWEVYKAITKAVYKTDQPPDVCLTPLLDILIMTAHAVGVSKESFLRGVEMLWDDVSSELDSHAANELLDLVDTPKKPSKKDFNVN